MISVELDLTLFKVFCGLANVKSFTPPSGLCLMRRFQRFLYLILRSRQLLSFHSLILLLAFLVQSAFL